MGLPRLAGKHKMGLFADPRLRRSAMNKFVLFALVLILK
jgi:hypothetical protein